MTVSGSRTGSPSTTSGWKTVLSSVAVAGLQGILGGLTVLKLLHYWLPVMHACLAQIMFVTLVSIAVVTSRWWVSERPQYETKPALRFTRW